MNENTEELDKEDDTHAFEEVVNTDSFSSDENK